MRTSPEPTGTIYDIGYRRYEGVRLGRRAAIGAIVGAGVRAVFGLGRSVRSKWLPWGAVILAIIPAGVAVAIKVLAGDIVACCPFSSRRRLRSSSWATCGTASCRSTSAAPSAVSTT